VRDLALSVTVIRPLLSLRSSVFNLCHNGECSGVFAVVAFA